MVKRYGYTLTLAEMTGGTVDSDGYRIPATTTWTEFQADIQTKAGKYMLDENQNQISVDYSVFVAPTSSLTFPKGSIIKIDTENFTIINSFTSPLNIEYWVTRNKQ